MSEKRDWVFRFGGESGQVLRLGVSQGVVEVYPPRDADCLYVEHSQFAEFRGILDQAVERAEADLREAGSRESAGA